MKLRLTALVLTLALLSSACSSAYNAYERRWCSTEWQGEVNEDMVKRVKQDLSRFNYRYCSTAWIYLNSPGGSVIDGLEIVRLMELARESMILEVHGGPVVASMATFILASGTPGHRYTWRYTLTLIHAPKTQRGDSEWACLAITPLPKTEEEKLANTFVTTVAEVYAKLTGRPLLVTKTWVECGKEQAGNGELLVRLGLADFLEP